MRRIPPFLLLLAISGCSLPEARWEKAGADEKMTASDLSNCRLAAQQEAFETLPYYGFAGYGPPSRTFYRSDYFYGGERFYAEGRLTEFCMRNKGYQLVAIQPPQTKAPPQAASPATTDK